MSDPATPQNTSQHPDPPDTAEESLRPLRIARGKRARERVLRAALEVLAEQGMPGFTMEAIAQRARASKATVYRHWQSQSTLLVEAMELVSRPFPVPATGQLRTDLIEIVSNLEALFSDQSFPRLLAAFIDAAERDPTLKSLHFELTERRREPLRQVLREARQRGDIPSTTELELAIDLLVGPGFYRRFIAHRPFPHDFATTVVDHVLTAIGHTQKDLRDH